MICVQCRCEKLSEEMLSYWENEDDPFPYHPFQCKHPLSICLECASNYGKCVTCEQKYSMEERNFIIKQFCEVTNEIFHDKDSFPIPIGSKITFNVSEGNIPECLVLYSSGEEELVEPHFIFDENNIHCRITIILDERISQILFMVKSNTTFKDLRYTITDDMMRPICVIDISNCSFSSSLIIGDWFQNNIIFSHV